MADADDEYASPEQWGATVAGLIDQAMNASSALERRKLEAQIRDADEGRKNAMKIAQLSASTSRYGVDAQAKAQAAALKQRAREFEQTHALELKKFGLSYAQTATEFLSSPDRFAQSTDFFDMAGRVMGRVPGPAPYGSNTDFVPKTQQDFAVLAGGAPEGLGAATPGSTAAAQSQPSPSAPVQAAVASASSPAAASGGAATAQADPRQKLLKNLFDVSPPSRGAGQDQNDFAVMKAADAIMSMPLPPGAYERMRPDQQKILGSYIRRSGRSLPDWLSQQQRNAPGQGSVRAAG